MNGLAMEERDARVFDGGLCDRTANWPIVPHRQRVQRVASSTCTVDRIDNSSDSECSFEPRQSKVFAMLLGDLALNRRSLGGGGCRVAGRGKRLQGEEIGLTRHSPASPLDAHLAMKLVKDCSHTDGILVRRASRSHD